MVITALAVVVVALAALSGDSTAPLYAEDLREQAVTVSRKAGVFQDVLTRVSSVDRVELVGVVDEIEVAIADARAFIADVENPPDGAAPVAVLFGLALDSWEQGCLGLERALLDAADGVAGSSPEDRAVNALLDLRAGDRLYASSVQQLTESDVTPPVSPMPVIAFLPTNYPIVAGAATFIGSAASEGSPLELRAELQITNLTTEPAWVVDAEGGVTVEFTETLSFKVVVSNAGNALSRPAELTLEIVGADGSNQSFLAPVESLEPGLSTTIAFEGIGVVPATAYQVAVRLPLSEGEAETADNAVSERFTVNQPTPTTGDASDDGQDS